MTYIQLIRRYGSAAKVATALGCTRQAVHRWKYIGVPMAMQIRAEVDSDGALRANLPEAVREQATP